MPSFLIQRPKEALLVPSESQSPERVVENLDERVSALAASEANFDIGDPIGSGKAAINLR